MTSEIARLALFAAAGVVLGAASMATLRLNTALYLGGRGVAAPIVLHLVRLAVIGAALFWSAKLGADVLLAVAAGVVVVRPFAVGRLAGLKR